MLGLEGLAMLLEVAHRLVAGPDLAGDLLVAVDDLAHAGFDLIEIRRGERLVPGEVVIEAVLDRRAEGDLGAGIKLLHRLRSEEHTSELQSLMRISYAVFCLRKKKQLNGTQLAT